MSTTTHDGDPGIEASTPLRVHAMGSLPAGYIRFGRYSSGDIAIDVLDEGGRFAYTATILLLSDGVPDPGAYGVWLRCWLDYQDVPKTLVDAGIVTLTGQRHPTGRYEAQHAQLTEQARAALNAKRRTLMVAAHREVDALVELGVIGTHRAEELKRSLTREAVEQHDQDGMSIRDIVDMYRDVAGQT